MYPQSFQSNEPRKTKIDMGYVYVLQVLSNDNHTVLVALPGSTGGVEDEMPAAGCSFCLPIPISLSFLGISLFSC
jgi:hypothetical protein